MKNLILIDDEDLDLRRSVEILEKHKVLHAMKLFSGNQMRMSKALGISRGSLQYKMKQMGLL
jgi:transcriptional regulator with PAS, ATPase and Fis domain